MKILPDSPPPPPPHAFRSSLRHRNRTCEIEICTESLRTINLSIASEAEEDCIHDDLPPQKASLRSSSYNDRIGFSGYGTGFYAEKLQFCSSQANTHKDDDDDDGMQWANAMGPLQMALRSFGYGDSKGLCTAKMASGKENKVRFPCKLASFPSPIARQQHAGPIKPNSGPFLGPLRVTAKLNSVLKANMAPSIIPVKLFCKDMHGFDGCEPMSPKVTCLGRIKIKESTGNKDVHATTDDKPAQKVEKGRCFDTKNQLCGRKAKGRKKKKISEKSRCLSRRRRFASKEASDSNSFSFSLSSELGSAELGETRREKAAFLARSLTGLLEDMRCFEEDRAQYVPSVPPPNSLLLMRGGRVRDEICSPIRGGVDEDDHYVRNSLRVETVDEDGPCEATVKNFRNSVPPLNSLLLMRGGRVRGEICSPIRGNMDAATIDDRYVHDSLGVETVDEDGPCEANVKNLRTSAPLHLSLLELIDMEDEDFSTSDIEDTMTTQRAHAKAQGASLSERENFEAVENDDKKNESVDEGCSLMLPPRGSLWQRRAITELTAIEVKQRTKQEIKQLIIR